MGKVRRRFELQVAHGAVVSALQNLVEEQARFQSLLKTYLLEDEIETALYMDSIENQEYKHGEIRQYVD